jgi:hypothetical protein
MAQAEVSAAEFLVTLRSPDGEISGPYFLCAKHMENRIASEPDGENAIYPFVGVAGCQDCDESPPQ